jgi:cytohesin
MELLIARGNPLTATEFGHTPFQVAAAAGQLEAMKLLLAKGVKPDDVAPQTHGETALYLACFEGQLEAVRLLVEKGANVRAKDAGRGRTPLHAVVDRAGMDDKRREIVELLIAKGADVNAKDNEGKTPLALAVSSRNEPGAALLRQHGATE